MILKGEKKEEYREFKDFYISRLLGFPYPFPNISPEDFKKFDIVRFRNGYGKNVPSFDIECKGIEFREGNPEWGAIPGMEYFVIKLGEIIKQ